MKYEGKLSDFSLKRKYDVDIENCLPQVLGKVLKKLFNNKQIIMLFCLSPSQRVTNFVLGEFKVVARGS